MLWHLQGRGMTRAALALAALVLLAGCPMEPR